MSMYIIICIYINSVDAHQINKTARERDRLGAMPARAERSMSLRDRGDTMTWSDAQREKQRALAALQAEVVADLVKDSAITLQIRWPHGCTFVTPLRP